MLLDLRCEFRRRHAGPSARMGKQCSQAPDQDRFGNLGQYANPLYRLRCVMQDRDKTADRVNQDQTGVERQLTDQPPARPMVKAECSASQLAQAGNE